MEGTLWGVGRYAVVFLQTCRHLPARDWLPFYPLALKIFIKTVSAIRLL